VTTFVIQRHTWLWVRLLSEVVESSNPIWTPSPHVLCIQVVRVETVIRVISLKQNKTKQEKKNKGIHGFDISKKKGNTLLATQALQHLGYYMIASSLVC
jgi:hypothetical protein